MGPVRLKFETDADYKFRYARYCLKWLVGFVTLAAVIVPVAYFGHLPPPVLIVVAIVMVFGLGMPALGALGFALGGWQAQRTPSLREQHVLRICLVVISVPLFLGVQALLWKILWDACLTHEITQHNRSRPSVVYHLATEPVGFLLTFGLHALVSLVMPGVALYVWRGRRLKKRRLHVRQPGI